MKIQITHGTTFGEVLAARGLADLLKSEGIGVELLSEVKVAKQPSIEPTVRAEGTAWRRTIKKPAADAPVKRELPAPVSSTGGPTQRERVLEQLRKAPATSDALVEITGISQQSMYACLSGLKRSMEVDKGEDGLWRIVE